MRLIRCYIENFGLLHSVEHRFTDGLNCIFTDNGTGKTTLSVFIRSMLYGLSDTRKVSLEENDRKKYLPWQGGAFGGSLTIEVGGKEYVIERSFGAKPADDRFTLRNAATGAVSYDYTENIGEEVFGIDRDGFSRTVFLGEKAITDKKTYSTVAAKLADMVGTDGNLGDYDTALKRLEDERRFYYKRGGGGEIGAVRAKIEECNRELDMLTRKSEELVQKELRLEELRRQIDNCEQQRKALSLRLEEVGKAQNLAEYEEKYRQMTAELQDKRQRLAGIKDFFRDCIPTRNEIDRARVARTEGNRLMQESGYSEDEEYARLYTLYNGKTDFEELGRVEKNAVLLSEYEERLDAFEARADADACRMDELFPSGAPTEEQIDNCLRLSKKTSRLPAALGAALGICLLIAGAISGYMILAYLYALCAVGAVIGLVCGYCLMKAGSAKETDLFFGNIGRDDKSGSVSERLQRLRRDLAEYERLSEYREGLIRKLECDRDRIKEELKVFTERFPHTVGADDSERIRRINTEYSKFYSLSLVGKERDTEKAARAEAASRLIRESEDFISRFKVTEDDDPIEQIRRMTDEYEYLYTLVARLTDECALFRQRYNITGASPAELPKCEQISEELRLCEQALTAYRRDYALLEREYNSDIADCDRRDEILAVARSLAEKLEGYEKNLSVIQRTSELLREASENMTARYIGKTKERFEYYEGAVSEVESEFNIDTDFTLTRSDRGKTRSEDSYSRGTKALYTLAMQLALTDSLYEAELPFIILDDPFIALDDDRCKRAKLMLKKISKDRQVIYFTCASSRAI